MVLHNSKRVSLTTNRHILETLTLLAAELGSSSSFCSSPLRLPHFNLPRGQKTRRARRNANVIVQRDGSQRQVRKCEYASDISRRTSSSRDVGAVKILPVPVVLVSHHYDTPKILCYVHCTCTWKTLLDRCNQTNKTALSRSHTQTRTSLACQPPSPG